MEIFSRSQERSIVDLRKPILVVLESFSTLQDLKVVSDDGSTIETTLIHLDTLSRNKTYYGGDDTQRSLDESKFVQENIAQQTWFGEFEHPPANSPLERFMFVEPTRYAWLIRKYWRTNDLIKGVCTFVPPLGTQIIEPIIKKIGSNFAASIRAYTPNFVKKDGPDGKYIIKKYPMYPVTFDCVTTPGLYKSRMVDPDVYGKLKKEKTGSENASSYIVFDNPENSLKKMLESESKESIKILEDLFNFDYASSNVILSKHHAEITSNENVKLKVPLNSYLLNEVLKK